MGLPLRRDDIPSRRPAAISKGALASRRKFLRYFPGGFHDQTYLDWERGYKWAAHQAWEESLGAEDLQRLLRGREFQEIAGRAAALVSRSKLVYSFEQMALRDGLRSLAAARRFSEGLNDFLHGPGAPEAKFERWRDTIESLPRKQSRVLTWPVVTVFGFLAQPRSHIYLKPRVTRQAAQVYGFDFDYRSRPAWPTYASLLEFAQTIRHDQADLRPRDMIDLQSFIWVLGSDEYPD